MKILEYVKGQTFIPVDEWIPEEQDLIFRHLKDEFIAPISAFLNVPQNMQLDCFGLKAKKAYRSEDAREHFCHYLNYFEKFYDQDKELVSIYAHIKCMIDGEKERYTIDLLKQDLERYMLSDSMRWKVTKMNDDNYIPLQKEYKYKNKPGLEYNDEHCKYMFYLSVLQIMIIPVISHYAQVNHITKIDDFLLQMYDVILYMKDASIDIYNKFYETVRTTTDHNVATNPIWKQQSIRGINPTTFAIGATNNIVLNLLHKYVYSGGVVAMNLSSIRRNINYQVITNEYEYTYIKLDATKRDEDSNSEFDKFESYTAKQDESLYIQLDHIARSTMRMINNKYGPFSQEEIDYYKNHLWSDTSEGINLFQRNLVFNLFYKYFGDPQSIKGINRDDYIVLVLAAKKILTSNGMVVLPYVISSKVEKLISRKTINKKEQEKIETGELYNLIMEKYSFNPKIKDYILSLIATIHSSVFTIIDYNQPELNGKELPIYMDFLREEVRQYVMLI